MNMKRYLYNEIERIFKRYCKIIKEKRKRQSEVIKDLQIEIGLEYGEEV